MEWLNIHTSTIDSDAYVRSTPTQRATWLNLLRYCCGQENGGRIPAAGTFTDRVWQQLAGVTLAEVQEDCPLWKFDGPSDLFLEFYPVEREALVKRNRLLGSIGGKARAASADRTRADSASQASASSGVETDASTEGKGRKGKEREGKGRGSAPAPPDSEIPSEAEFLAAFLADAIPEDYLQRQFSKFHESHTWLNAQQQLVDWPRILRRRWAEDRAAWQKAKPNGAHPSAPDTPWNLQKKIDAEEDAIRLHPANGMGTRPDPNPTEEQRADLKQRRDRVRQWKEKIAA